MLHPPSITPAVLESSVDERNMIQLSLSGDLGPKQMDDFVAWTAKIKKSMVEVDTLQHGRVLSLIDISRLNSFSMELLAPLQEVMHFNAPYATKTAVYGPNLLISTILRSTIVLTHRTNMKIFGNREDALAWLLADEATPHLSV